MCIRDRGYAVEFLDEETIFSRYGENGITGYDLVNEEVFEEISKIIEKIK